jgi:photosystem II stability/assembly factor-like uncharacterized protein
MRYLGCHTLDDVEEPGGGINELIRCFKSDGTGWEILGNTRTPPDPITTTVTGLITTAADWLERIAEGANCPFPLYVNGKGCPPYDVFGGATRWYALEHAEIGTRGLMGLAHREEDNVSEQSFEITAWPPLLRGRAIATERIGFSGTENLNDIASCSTPRCAGDCGAAVDACDMLVAVADGDPASADVWISFDNGVTWAATATDPYLGTTTDLKSVSCFAIDSDTTRILVAREAVAGMPMHVYYSDDNGANWTDVAVGGTHGYGATYGGSMFAIDMYHIWLVTTDGVNGSEMWFSEDGGETWAEQTLGDNTQFYYAVYFSNDEDGMVVGAADAIEASTDGETWATATATGSGDDLYIVTENRGGLFWWVGSDGGDIWYSNDHGVAWTQGPFPGDGAGAVYAMDWASQTVGFMAHSPTAATGRVYRTRNGGTTWELESATVDGELYSTIACSINQAWTVGEVDTTALVLKSHD